MSSEMSLSEKLNEDIIRQDAFSTIRDLHEKVSMEDTPKTYVKKKMGMDYVEISYMKSVADKHYPGWSWTIISTEMLGSEAFMVHGRLKWFEGGIWREGDMTAAHRIMKLRDKEGFVDVGNDIKSANTDAMKKAFNMLIPLFAPKVSTILLSFSVPYIVRCILLLLNQPLRLDLKTFHLNPMLS